MTNKPQNILNPKLGLHRGKVRVFVEGQTLSTKGYHPGIRYNKTQADGCVKLTPANDGDFKVSKRTSKSGVIKPVLDVRLEEFKSMFGPVSRVTILISEESILITAHQSVIDIFLREERAKLRLHNGLPLRIGSVCHGGGVLDRSVHDGFKIAGFDCKVAFAIERESAYLNASVSNNRELWDEQSCLVLSELQQVDLKTLFQQVGHIDVLVAGLPCTGASKSGKSSNGITYAEEHKEAGHLFFYFLEIVRMFQPLVIQLENVPDYQDTTSMIVIRSVLADLGYNVHERLLNGNEFGSLENRTRMCAVAVSKGVDTLNLDNVIPLRTKESKIEDVLEEVSLDSDAYKTYDYLKSKEMRDSEKGNGFKRELLTGKEDSCTTILRNYHKAGSTGQFLLHPYNPELSRLFTKREHCKIKTVPEDLISGLSATIAHQILGQGVIYFAFLAVAFTVGTALLEWKNKNTLSIAA